MNFKHHRRQQEFPLADNNVPAPTPMPSPTPPAKPKAKPKREVQVAWVEFYDACGLDRMSIANREIMRLSFFRGAIAAASIALDPPANYVKGGPITLDSLAMKQAQLRALRKELSDFCDECGAFNEELRRA